MFTHLILGTMPTNATPESHIAAGEWCFLNCESDFPQWMEQFTIVDDRPTAREDEQYVSQLMGWGLWHVHTHASHRNKTLPTPLSPYVWELLLGRWCTTVIPFLGLAYRVAQQAVERYGHLNLTVITASAPKPEWPDLGSLFYSLSSPEGFQVLLSQIIEKIAPKTWKLEVQLVSWKQEALQETFVTQCINWVSRKLLRKKINGPGLRTILHGLWQRLIATFPELPVDEFPFTSRWQRFFLSFILLFNRKKDQRNWPLLCKLYPGSGQEFPVWMSELLWYYLPPSFQSAEKDIAAQKSLFRNWVMGSRYCKDAEHLKHYARLAAGGVRLFTVQHAPLYFAFPKVTIAPAEEFNHAGMLRWGDASQPRISHSAVPVVYNTLWNSHHEVNKEIYYILDNQRPLNVCNSFSLWDQIRNNRKRLESFYAALPHDLRESLVLRHYPGGKYSFDSKHWPLGQTLPFAQGDNTSNMQRSRVVVTDYIASSFGQAMIINVPCLWIWDKKEYAYSSETEEVFSLLSSAGIMHQTPASAANFLSENWSDISSWWSSAKVQNARKALSRVDLGEYSAHPILKWARLLRRM